MTAQGNVKLFIVDDHPVVRHGLGAITEADSTIQVIAAAATAGDARRIFAEIRPDVILLDLRFPDGSGIELCREFKTRVPAPRVIILTSYADGQFLLDALAAGADGYLLKESDAHRIVEAIHTVRRGGTVFDPGAARHLAEHARDVRPESRLAELTVGERRILKAVATGFTDKQAAVELGLQPKTVRNHLDHIYQKLGVHTRTQAALVYVRVFGEPGSSKDP